MTNRYSTRAATWQEAEEEEAEVKEHAERPPNMDSVLKSTRAIHSSDEKIKYISVSTHRRLKTFGNGDISATEYVKTMQPVW